MDSSSSGISKIQCRRFLSWPSREKRYRGHNKGFKKKNLGLFSKATWDLWAYEAQVKAILHALIFCPHFHLKHILIESDFALAVSWVNNKVNRPWKLIQDLNLIDLLCIVVDCLGVNHIFRESNHLADYLAKSGCYRENEIWSLVRC